MNGHTIAWLQSADGQAALKKWPVELGQDVKRDCRRGIQWCHLCDDLECCDNTLLQSLGWRAVALVEHAWMKRLRSRCEHVTVSYSYGGCCVSMTPYGGHPHHVAPTLAQAEAKALEATE